MAKAMSAEDWVPPHDSNVRYNYFWQRKRYHETAASGAARWLLERPSEWQTDHGWRAPSADVRQARVWGRVERVQQRPWVGHLAHRHLD